MATTETAPDVSDHHGSPRNTHLAPRSPMIYASEASHHRAPSLGEIQQHGEEEQEAHFNRLRHLVRLEQERLAELQTNGRDGHDSNHAIMTSPPSSHLRDVFIEDPPSPALGRPPRSPMQRPASISRHSSSSTQAMSTRSPDDMTRSGLREEGAFYQAMKQMIERENHMLKERIRNLERELGETDEAEARQHGSAA